MANFISGGGCYNSMRWANDGAGAGARDWAAVADADIADHDSSAPLILAASWDGDDMNNIDGDFEVQFRNLTDVGAWTVMSGVTDIANGTGTDLVDGGAVVVGEEMGDSNCSGMLDGRMDGEEKEGANGFTFSSTKKLYFDTQWAIDFSGGTAEKEYEFRVVDTGTSDVYATMAGTVTLAAGGGAVITQPATISLTIGVYPATLAINIHQPATVSLTIGVYPATLAIVIVQPATISLTINVYAATVQTGTFITQPATVSLSIGVYAATLAINIHQPATISLTIGVYPATVAIGITQPATPSLTIGVYPAAIAIVITQPATVSLSIGVYQATIAIVITQPATVSLSINVYEATIIAGVPQVNQTLAGSATSITATLAGDGDSVLAALTGAGASILTTLLGASLMDTDRNFTIVRGTDVAQPWTVTLDQSRTLDGTETWSWTCRKNKGDGTGVLLTLTSAGGTITIDGGTNQPTLVFTDTATTEALFPSTNTEELYMHQLVMTKSGLVEAVAEGRMTVVGSV